MADDKRKQSAKKRERWHKGAAGGRGGEFRKTFRQHVADRATEQERLKQIADQLGVKIPELDRTDTLDYIKLNEAVERAEAEDVSGLDRGVVDLTQKPPESATQRQRVEIYHRAIAQRQKRAKIDRAAKGLSDDQRRDLVELFGKLDRGGFTAQDLKKYDHSVRNTAQALKSIGARPYVYQEGKEDRLGFEIGGTDRVLTEEGYVSTFGQDKEVQAKAQDIAIMQRHVDVIDSRIKSIWTPDTSIDELSDKNKALISNLQRQKKKLSDQIAIQTKHKEALAKGRYVSVETVTTDAGDGSREVVKNRVQPEPIQLRYKKETPQQRLERLREQRAEGIFVDDLPELPRGVTVDEQWTKRPEEGGFSGVETRGLGKGKPGWLPDDPRKWRGTIRAQHEQNKRAAKAIKDGTDYRGYRLWSSSGNYNPRFAPAEKADIYIGSNKDNVVTTTKWEFVDPERWKLDTPEPGSREWSWYIENPAAYPKNSAQSVLEFQTNKKVGQKDVNVEGIDVVFDPHKERLRAQGNEEIRPFTEWTFGGSEFDEPSSRVQAANLVVQNTMPLRQALAETLGKDNLKVKIHTLNAEGTQFSVSTEQGQFLNPDQLDALEASLQKEYGLGGDKGGLIIKEQPELQEKKVRSDVHASKVRGVHPSDVKYTEEKTKYLSKVAFKPGERDDTGKLIDQEKDTIGVVIPKKGPFGERAITAKFGEDTESIGWGRSWKPGQKEISHAVTEPIAEYRSREMQQAIRKGRTKHADVDKILKREMPDASQEKRDKVKHEIILAGEAGGAAVLYGSRRQIKTAVVNNTYARWSEDGLGKRIEDWLGARNRKTGEVFASYRDSVGRTTADWTLQRKWMVKHPITDPLSQEGLRISDLPSWKYRGGDDSPIKWRFGLKPEEVEMRDIERQRKNLLSRLNTRKQVVESLKEDPQEGNLKAKAVRKITQRKIRQMDSPQYAITGDHGLKEDISKHITDLRYYARDTDIPPARRRAAASSAGALQLKLNEINRGVYAIAPDVVENARAGHLAKTRLLPKGTGKASLALGAAVGVAGLGLYGYDKWKERQVEAHGGEANPITKKVWDTVTPKSVVYPTVSAPSVKYKGKIPANTYTVALDLENKRKPVGINPPKAELKRVSLRAKEAGYTPGPLASFRIGGFERPHPDAEAFVQSRNTKGAKVYGPVQVVVGKKDRFNTTKSNRLSTRNPSKVKPHEKAILALQGQGLESPEVRELYREMQADPELRAEVKNRYATYFQRPGGARTLSEMEKQREEEEKRLAQITGKTLGAIQYTRELQMRHDNWEDQ